PNAQSDSFVITGRTYGAYVYEAVVSNDAGSSHSDEKVFIFGGASTIVLNQADQGRQALQVTLPQGVQEYDLAMLANPSATFRVFTNNAAVVNPEVVGGRLRLTALAAGRASVRIQENATGTVRYVGVRVRTAAGDVPGLPDYLAVGSVSEDTPS